MKGSYAALVCAALLVAAVISSPIDKPKKNIKKYLYKKQGPAASGGDLYLPNPHKTKSNSYPSSASKLSSRSFPSVVYISDSPDDDSSPLSPHPQQQESGSATSGITDFFDRISRTFSRSGVNGGAAGAGGKKERYSPDPEQIAGYHDHTQDDEGPIQGPPHHQQFRPTAFPNSPVGDHLQDDHGEEPEDDEESGEDSDEDEEDDEEGDDNNDDAQDDLQQEEGGPSKNEQRQKLKNKNKNQVGEEGGDSSLSSSQYIGEPQIGIVGESQEEQPVQVQSSSSDKKKKDKNKKNKNKDKEQEEEEENAEEESEEEEENADEEEIPDDVPPFIRQSMIEAKRKKQQEEAAQGHHGQGQGQGQGHHPHGRPGGPPGGPQGQYGGGPPQQGQGQGGFGSSAGGFLSSLLG